MMKDDYRTIKESGVASNEGKPYQMHVEELSIGRN